MLPLGLVGQCQQEKVERGKAGQDVGQLVGLGEVVGAGLEEVYCHQVRQEVVLPSVRWESQ